MALIECPECKDRVSDTARSCPHCGAPVGALPFTADTPNPSPYVKEKSAYTSTLNTVLWIVGTVVFAIAGVLFFTLQGWKNALKAEEERIQRLPEIPIEVTYRQALLGPGLVVSFKNFSSRNLSVIATLTNPSLNQRASYRVDVSPNGDKELGHLEGWTFASGDTVHLTHHDYKPSETQLP
ncbi:MAG: hypothetical protein ACREV2_03065 [Burkholderiales bacterium]